MEYGIKLVFHLPDYFFHENIVYGCDNQGFRKELLGALAKAGAGYFFSIPAKTFIGDREFSCEHLVVYAVKDSYYSYVRIFQEMVCKYHSELKQQAYYYEQDNVLVSLVIGEEG